MNAAQWSREQREKHPADWCDKCLWHISRSGPCPKHHPDIECLYCFAQIKYNERSVSVNGQRDHRVHVGDCERYWREDRATDAREKDAADFIDEPLEAHYKRIPEPDRTGDITL